MNTGGMSYITSMQEVRDNTSTRHKLNHAGCHSTADFLRFFPILMGGSEELASSAVGITGERTAPLLFDFAYFLVGVITGKGGVD